MKQFALIALVVVFIFSSCSEDEVVNPPVPAKTYTINTLDGTTGKGKPGVKVYLTTYADYYNFITFPGQNRISKVTLDTGYAIFTVKEIKEQFGFSSGTLYVFADDTTNHETNLENFTEFLFDDRQSSGAWAYVKPSMIKSLSSASKWNLARVENVGIPTGTLKPCFNDNYIKFGFPTNYSGGKFVMTLFEGANICSGYAWTDLFSIHPNDLGSIGIPAPDSTSTGNYLPGFVQEFPGVNFDSASWSDIFIRVDKFDTLKMSVTVNDFFNPGSYTSNYYFFPEN